MHAASKKLLFCRKAAIMRHDRSFVKTFLRAKTYFPFRKAASLSIKFWDRKLAQSFFFASRFYCQFFVPWTLDFHTTSFSLRVFQLLLFKLEEEKFSDKLPVKRVSLFLSLSLSLSVFFFI